MKRILLGMVIGLAGLGFVAADVEAKRLGGGMSQGLKRPTPTQRQPDSPPPQQAPQQAKQQPGTPGAAAAAPAKRSWLGPLAGLAAGLGIAALMSHLGLGETFGNVLTLLLVLMVGVWLVRFLMRRFSPAAQLAGAPGVSGVPSPPVAAKSASPIGAMRSDLQPPASPAMQPLATPGSAGSRPALPPGFDLVSFERAAKMIFIRLQAANDRGDVEDLRGFSTPEMFAAFRVDLQDRGPSGQHTDAVQLDADVVDWAVDDGKQIVSVRYHGVIREDDAGETAPFDEVWHLVRPEDGSRSWAIAGIQQIALTAP